MINLVTKEGYTFSSPENILLEVVSARVQQTEPIREIILLQYLVLLLQ